MANAQHVARLQRDIDAWNGWRAENPHIVPDLSQAQLTYLDLSEANLAWANLAGADLQGANLSEADCRNATLHQADLRDAILIGTDFSEANLIQAQFNRADISTALLSRGANLTLQQINTAYWSPNAPPYVLVMPSCSHHDLTGLLNLYGDSDIRSMQPGRRY